MARKFVVPFIAKGQAEQGTVFHSLSHIGDYFQTYLDEYKSKGCVQCRYENLEVKWLGSQCSVASVDWALLDGAGCTVTSWSESYLLTIEPGMTTADLDKLGGELLDRYEARSAPRATYNFPGTTCISINEEAAHGVPSQRMIQAGDVVNVDVSAELNGYFADTGGTIVVPPVSRVKARLCHATRLALKHALAEARAGSPINRIGRAIQRTAKSHGFKVIRNLAGHGIGRSLHEDPEGIVSYYDRRDTRPLQLGQVIAIEPFLSTRSSHVAEAEDGWTLVGHPANLSAQYEHTIVVTKGTPIVATLSERRG